MKTIKITTLILLAGLFLASCTRSLVLNMTNNSGQRVKIYSYDTQTNATEYSVEQGLSADVHFPSLLKIVTEQHEWNYNLTGLRPVSGFQSARTFGPLEIKFQIEKDGTIFILSPKTKTPTSQFVPQPDGFPLRPQ